MQIGQNRSALDVEEDPREYKVLTTDSELNFFGLSLLSINNCIQSRL